MARRPRTRLSGFGAPVNMDSTADIFREELRVRLSAIIPPAIMEAALSSAARHIEISMHDDFQNRGIRLEVVLKDNRERTPYLVGIVCRNCNFVVYAEERDIITLSTGICPSCSRYFLGVEESMRSPQYTTERRLAVGEIDFDTIRTTLDAEEGKIETRKEKKEETHESRRIRFDSRKQD